MTTAQYITLAQCAAKHGLSVAVLRARCKRGKLPAVKMGRDWFVPSDYTPQTTRGYHKDNWKCLTAKSRRSA